MRPAFPLALTAIIALASNVWAAHEVFCSIAQPLYLEGPGVVVGEVPFVSYFDWMDPTLEILLTTKPNTMSTDQGPQDRNLAVRDSIRFIVDPPSERSWTKRTWPRLRADTLDVLVDLPDLEPREHTARVWREDVLTATLWCGLRNARTNWPTIKYVRYVIHGPKPYARYQGVYSLADVHSPAQLDEWSKKTLPPAMGE